MHENPLKPLRLASTMLYFEVCRQTEPDKAELQKLLDALNAEAHKFGLKVEIKVYD